MTRARSFLWGAILGAVIAIGAGWTLLTTDRYSTSFPNKTTLQIDPAVESLKDELNSLGNADATQRRKKYDILYNLLQTQYYHKEDIDQTKMQENALKWFVDALGDPYTVYLTPDENTMFGVEMQGSRNFEWIGAVVTKKEDWVLIEEVLKWHPAFQAGIKPLDVILEIDGESAQNLWLNEAVDKIRGPKGTSVTLKIYRESETKIMDIIVTREAISVPSVRGELVDHEGKSILYIEILSFGDDTKKIFANFIQQFPKSTLDGVIVDLRGNGGGYLPIAVDISWFFIPKGKLITTAKYSTFPEESYTSAGYKDLEGVPLVVLIDGLSASASEITAAALQQQAGAVLVGQKTFGKWSIQTLHDNADGSSIKYTIGARYMPDGSNVDKDGILPDVEVAFDATQYLSGWVDTQLEVAKEELLKVINQ